MKKRLQESEAERGRVPRTQIDKDSRDDFHASCALFAVSAFDVAASTPPQTEFKDMFRANGATATADDSGEQDGNAC